MLQKRLVAELITEFFGSVANCLHKIKEHYPLTGLQMPRKPLISPWWHLITLWWRHSSRRSVGSTLQTKVKGYYKYFLVLHLWLRNIWNSKSSTNILFIKIPLHKNQSSHKQHHIKIVFSITSKYRKEGKQIMILPFYYSKQVSKKKEKLCSLVYR